MRTLDWIVVGLVWAFIPFALIMHAHLDKKNAESQAELERDFAEYLRTKR